MSPESKLRIGENPANTEIKKVSNGGKKAKREWTPSRSGSKTKTKNPGSIRAGISFGTERKGIMENKTEIRSAYPDKPYRNPFYCTGESRTKQADAEACDINNIMKRYEKTGVLEHIAKNPGRYEHLPGGLDYQLALNLAIGAKEAFDALPGILRAKFGNDAETFLDFMDDPENEKEIIELGLREPEAPVTEEPPIDVHPVPNIESVPE